jgi:hypothetical protein
MAGGGGASAPFSTYCGHFLLFLRCPSTPHLPHTSLGPALRFFLVGGGGGASPAAAAAAATSWLLLLFVLSLLAWVSACCSGNSFFCLGAGLESAA